MTDLHAGAVRLPTQHVSVRVPWHDTAWTGRICEAPSKNSHCIILKNIHESKQDDVEDRLATQDWADVSAGQLPPCVSERVGFMRSHSFDHMRVHPYASSPSHHHLVPTRLSMPAYAALAVPFRWMMREQAEKIAGEYDLGYRPELEERAHELIGFSSAKTWLQDAHNQRILLDTFFSALEPSRSVVFFYAKSVPLVDHIPGQRILIGVGQVTGVGPPTEWASSRNGPIRTFLWERAVLHSIRPAMTDGFLLPYHDLLAHLSSAEDLSPYVAFAPDEHWQEFSYASELVGHDAAIAGLLAIIRAVERSREHVPGPWDQVLTWCDSRLNDIWRYRGPAPGLGSALVALGIDRGTVLANRIVQNLEPNEDPWPATERAFAEAPSGKGPAQGIVGDVQARLLANLPEDRARLLRLLSRFALSPEQAGRFFRPELRHECGIDAADVDLLENPYLLYELDRYSVDPIRATAIDRGVFPVDTVRSQHPLPISRPVIESVDARRVRALAVTVAEEAAAEEGHTVIPKNRLLVSVQQLPIEPRCPLTSDVLHIVGDFFEPIIRTHTLATGEEGFQLDRLAEHGDLIRRTVNKRLAAGRHNVEADWRARLDALLGTLPKESVEREDEERARDEKAAALEELAASRFSILVGPAGTGKTLLLQVLCAHPNVERDGVLLLAPTGKARVQLQQATSLNAHTIAQFLLPLDRYEPQTGWYRRSSRPKHQGVGTVIIDEASMLTEDQLAATIDALAGVKRLILVGDHRQLPPIGAGRPFVDIVRRCRQAGRGYAELRVLRRHIGGERDDLEVAAWFTSSEQPPGSDEVWGRIGSGGASETVRLVRWDSDDELEERLIEVFRQELSIEREDPNSFATKLGAVLSERGHAYYNLGSARHAESWQILAPLRSRASGVVRLNRLIQRLFRSEALRFAREQYWVPLPVGSEEIVYGDKVICVRNHRRRYWSREKGALEGGYIANGEIGLVVGRFKTHPKDPRPSQVNVEFSSQLARSYTFGRKGDFGEGGEILELAYAITVHKAQGSQFSTTILVLPNPCALLAPELLYTALTRHQQRVIVLHQGAWADLKPYTAPHLSITARRLTRLFDEPEPVEIAGHALDGRYVHRTVRGEAVRSKSEVIIANLLHARGIDYQYEAPFTGADGTPRWPDFTIDDPESGERYYWEHLGLLSSAGYRRKWNSKLEWYRSNGIELRENGGGTTGTLIMTEDSKDGYLDSARIDRVIQEAFG